MKILILLGLLTSAAALAGTGGSTAVGGGGEIDISGRPALRDLVDGTTCLWEDSEGFKARMPQAAKVLAAVENAHWYLARKLNEEAKQVRFCLSEAELKTVPTEDEKAVAIARFNGKQLAVRINKMIFVNMALFRLLPEDQRPYLFLHELSHGLIPMDVERRNQKLRSFIAALEKNEKSPMSRTAFDLQLEMNDVAVPRLTKGMQLCRSDLETLLANREEAKNAEVFLHLKENCSDAQLGLDGFEAGLVQIDLAIIAENGRGANRAAVDLAKQANWSGYQALANRLQRLSLLDTQAIFLALHEALKQENLAAVEFVEALAAKAGESPRNLNTATSFLKPFFLERIAARDSATVRLLLSRYPLNTEEFIELNCVREDYGHSFCYDSTRKLRVAIRELCPAGASYTYYGRNFFDVSRLDAEATKVAVPYYVVAIQLNDNPLLSALLSSKWFARTATEGNQTNLGASRWIGCDETTPEALVAKKPDLLELFRNAGVDWAQPKPQQPAAQSPAQPEPGTGRKGH